MGEPLIVHPSAASIAQTPASAATLAPQIQLFAFIVPLNGPLVHFFPLCCFCNRDPTCLENVERKQREPLAGDAQRGRHAGGQIRRGVNTQRVTTQPQLNCEPECGERRFSSLLTPLHSLLAFGRSGLRPSLVQGLRPRNAPLQKHASSTVRRNSNGASRPRWRRPTSTRRDSLNGGMTEGLFHTSAVYGSEVTAKGLTRGPSLRTGALVCTRKNSRAGLGRSRESQLLLGLLTCPLPRLPGGRGCGR